MKHVFVFDPDSFKDEIQDRIGMYFRTQEKHAGSISIQKSRFPRDALGIIQKEIDEAKDDDTIRVYAIGGDEIFFDCLNGVAGVPNLELAVAPYGRTHDLIRAFGEGKMEQFRNFQTLIPSPTIPTDVIDTGNNYAIIGCAVGFAPTVVMRARKWKEVLGIVNNFFVINKILAFFGNLVTGFNKEVVTQHYEITIDDKDYSGNYSLINVSNCPYYDGNKIGVAGAIPDDGLLDVALFKSVGPLKTLMSLGSYSREKVPSNCVLLQARKVSIRSENPVWIRQDCEFFQGSSITFEVIPGAIQIAAPDNLSYQKR